MGKHYNPNGIPILGYHGLFDDPKKDRVGWGWTSTSDFFLHLDYLKAKDYNPITFEELIRHYLQGPRKSWPKKKPIVITFDDGYYCVYEKLLARHLSSFKAYLDWFKSTIFLVVDCLPKYPTTRPEFDGFEVLSLSEILDMANTKAFWFGSHSLTHFRFWNSLIAEDWQQLERELRESRSILNQFLDDSEVGFAFANVFAYPYGERHFRSEVLQYVQKAGYECAVDYNERLKVNNEATNRFRLYRIAMTYACQNWQSDYNNLSSFKKALLDAPAAWS